MASKNRITTNKNLAEELVRQYPGAPKKSLARVLQKKYPKHFVSLESAYTAVRWATGAKGAASRKTADPKLVYAGSVKKPQYMLPKGLKQVKPPKSFNKPGDYLFLTDIHVPYHDEKAIEAAVKYAVDRKIPNLVINGDGVDFYKFSDYGGNPKNRDPDEELVTFREVLAYLSSHFKGVKIYKCGNHEDRYERYLARRAEALVGMPGHDLESVLGIRQFGFDWVESRQYYKLGKLNCFHGHELPKGLASPVNISRGVYLKLQEPGIVGHWHRTSCHVETSGLKAHVTTCYSVGCLCDLNPAYGPVNSWNHGFAVVTVAANGDYNVQNKTILNGKIYATE